MSGIDNPYGIDTDYSATTGDFAATSSRVGTAVGSPQAGRVHLFRTPAGTFGLANVDGNGAQYVNAVSPSGGPLLVYTGQPAGATTTQFGSLVMGRMDTPGPATYQAFTLDMTGALNVHPKSKATFNLIQTAVSCAANKSLFSVVNTGSMVFRVQRIYIYQPPQNTSGALLGQGGTLYVPLIAEVRRITGHTRGASTTTPTWSACDSADMPDAGLGALSNAVVSGAATAPFHRQDILITTATGNPFLERSDTNAKVLVIRPGEGFTVTCLSSGQIASGSGTTTASVDLEVQLTQAVA